MNSERMESQQKHENGTPEDDVRDLLAFEVSHGPCCDIIYTGDGSGWEA